MAVCALAGEGFVVRLAANPRVHAAQSAGGNTSGMINALPGMPPVLDPNDVYSADGPGMIGKVASDYPSRVYVPNSKSDTVDIIDPQTYKIIGHFALPKDPKHPSTLWNRSISCRPGI